MREHIFRGERKYKNEKVSRRSEDNLKTRYNKSILDCAQGVAQSQWACFTAPEPKTPNFEEWVEGYLNVTTKKTGILWDGIIIEVIPDTIQEWTGKKDKNGTRVFEGDIILLPEYFSGKSFRYYVVVWEPMEARFILECPANPTLKFEMKIIDDLKAEVVGNILSFQDDIT